MTNDDHVGALSCAEVLDLAPELGLGVLAGAERASALAHLESCPSCRAVVETTAEAADSLFALAPELEPPAGFEARVIGRANSVARASRRHWAATALSAIASAAAAALLVVSLQGSGQSRFHVQDPARLQAMGGRELFATTLSRDGHAFGQAFVFAGQPSWVLMTVDSEGSPRRLTCELKTANGNTIVLGSFTVAGGYRSWGSTIAISARQIRRVLLVGPDARPVASATL
jgi:hypothetical protein